MIQDPDTADVRPEPGPDASQVAAPDDAAGGAADQPVTRGRRRHRRAVGGTVPPGPEPRVGERSPDDLDVGWGEQPSGSDDERFLREVPPHW